MTERIWELGRWLSLYHKAEESRAGIDEAVEWILASFKRKLDALRSTERHKSEIIRGFEQYYSREASRALRGSNPVTLAKVHGDFISYNMIVDRKSVVHIIDFADSRVSLALEDVVRFWEHLWAIASTTGRRSKLLLPVCSAFLRGYGVSDEIVLVPEFRALRMYNVLTNLLAARSAKDYLGIGGRKAARMMEAASLRWVMETCQALKIG